MDARVLLEHVLEVGHAHLIAHPERALSAAEAARFAELCRRRLAGEPVAYLVGWREFYGRRFRVDPAVLIPRPETELLIELAIERMGRVEPTEPMERMSADRGLKLLDLGTGSGIIAVTLALELPGAEVVATDASAAALELARANASALGAGNAHFRHGDWFAPVAGARFDLIVSNPPYVAAADLHLGRGDLRFEPRGALIAGPDGLACIRHIVSEAWRFLEPGGWLLFEHGYDQAEACAALLRAVGYGDRFCARDLAGQPRVSGGHRVVSH